MTVLYNISLPSKAPETKDSTHMYNTDDTYINLSHHLLMHSHSPNQVTYKVLMDIYKANADFKL